MASQGPLYAGTAANFNDAGNVAWSSPTNVQGDTTATAATAAPGAAGATSQRLRATNFGFSIPSGNTITGILIEVERQANSANRGGWATNGVQVMKGGVDQASVGADTANWTTTKQIESWGGDGNLLGATLTPVDVNAIGFGASFKVIRNGNAVTASIFRVRITVFHVTPVADAIISGAGGGAGSVTQRTTRLQAAMGSGGGAGTASSLTRRATAASGSGGGAGGVAQRTTRSSALGGSGGGSAAVAYELVIQAELHEAVIAGSGGGGAAAVASTVRNGDVAGTGGGSAALDAATVRFVGMAGAGAGAGDIVATAVHADELGGSGGGSGSIVATTARSLTLTASGGGNAGVAQITEREAAIVADGGGGGAIVYEASWGNTRSAAITGTGGGGALVIASSRRGVAMVASGGGRGSIVDVAIIDAEDVPRARPITISIRRARSRAISGQSRTRAEVK